MENKVKILLVEDVPSDVELIQRELTKSGMQIIVNGESTEIREGLTAVELVHILDLVDQRIAMEVNLEIVPRGKYDSFIFQPGDKVEVVRAIGGG